MAPIKDQKVGADESLDFFVEDNWLFAENT
jgi:hypothetical protein